MTVTQAEYRKTVAEAMPEAALLQRVREIARVHGWLAYHTHRSERSEPGFPDLVLVHPAAHRLVFAELKRQSGHLTDHQKAWHSALLQVWVATEYPDREGAGAPVISAHIWRPADLLDGKIEAVLRP